MLEKQNPIGYILWCFYPACVTSCSDDGRYQKDIRCKDTHTHCLYLFFRSPRKSAEAHVKLAQAWGNVSNWNQVNIVNEQCENVSSASKYRYVATAAEGLQNICQCAVHVYDPWAGKDLYHVSHVVHRASFLFSVSSKRSFKDSLLLQTPSVTDTSFY